MKKVREIKEQYEQKLAQWMKHNAIFSLRISVGLIFIWFGVLKFFPGVSPAQDLAIRTIEVLSFGMIPASYAIIILAVWESLIGLGFLIGKFQKLTIILLFLQMLGTFTPIFIFPNEVFTTIPYAPTLEGQYIIKNLVIVSAGFVIGARVFGKGRSLSVIGDR